MTIYLIGGPPKCGKTTLAKKLSKKLSIPWISADTLQNIAYTYTNPRYYKKYFPYKYMKGKDNDETYSKYSCSEIINGYVNQGKTSYKAISMVSETQIIDEDDYIIEGYQVTPEIVYEIIKKFGIKNIKTVFLVKNDKKKFVEDISKSTTPNDWIIRKTFNKETYLKIAEMISLYSNYFEQEANKYNLPLLVMDENFEEKIDQAISLLTR